MNGFGDYDRWKCDPDWDDDDEDDDFEYEPWEGDQPDTECIGDDCLFAGEHFRSECFTAEDCERQAEQEFWSQYPEVL